MRLVRNVYLLGNSESLSIICIGIMILFFFVFVSDGLNMYVMLSPSVKPRAARIRFIVYSVCIAKCSLSLDVNKEMNKLISICFL